MWLIGYEQQKTNEREFLKLTFLLSAVPIFK